MSKREEKSGVIATEMVLREIYTKSPMMPEYDYSKSYQIRHERSEFCLEDIIQNFFLPILVAMGYNFDSICDIFNTEATEYHRSQRQQEQGEVEIEDGIPLNYNDNK